MHRRQLARPSAPTLSVRAACFEDVSAILRLIEGAIEHGCRDHYTSRQRLAVYLRYASQLFADAVGPYHTLVAELGGQLAAAAQLDVATGALRALFVDAALQGHGYGRALLAVEMERARAAGGARLGGAMSRNAVPSYEQAGFVPCRGQGRRTSAGLPVQVTKM